MNHQTFVTIIIPTYKDTDALMLCLTALAKQDYPSQSFEVVIINNNPDEQIEPFLEFPQLRIINETQPGSYAARNTGLRYARGEVVAFTDADCIPERNWISNAIDALCSSPQAERVTGPVKIFKKQGGTWLAWKFESITAFNQKYNASNGLSVTANLFVKREVFELVGNFDQNLLSGGDFEWNQRASNLGIKLNYSESVVVNHPARKSLSKIFYKYKRVCGGSYARAKREHTVLSFLIRHIVPPCRYSMVLMRDKKPPIDVFFAFFLIWIIRVFLIFEIFRLILGGKPNR